MSPSSMTIHQSESSVFSLARCEPSSRGSAETDFIARIKSSVTESRINGLLTSNEQPLDSETADLSSLLAECAILLSDFTGGAKEYNILREQYRRLKCILHPARQVPAEVWSLIFGWSVASIVANQPITDLISTLDPQFTAWILCRVCSGWRRIVQDHAALWSQISVVVEDAADTLRLTQMSHLLDIQLGFTSDMALTVQIGLSGSLHESPGTIILLRKLMATSMRWRFLALHLHISSFESAFDTVKSRLPKLEELYIFYPVLERALERRYFEDCPSLRHLSCTYLDPGALELPLDQLESFEVVPTQGREPTPYISRELLSQMWRLKECTFRCTDPVPSTWRRSLELLTLPHLIKLKVILEDLREIVTHDVSSIWERLALPELTTLEIIGELDVTKFLAFKDRSGCWISDLSIESSKLSGRDLIRLLAALPTLISLSLNCDHTGLKSALLDALCAPMDSSSFLPSLQRLSIPGPPPGPQSPESSRRSVPILFSTRLTFRDLLDTTRIAIEIVFP